MFTPKQPDASGFTLIELLVVVAIIAIIAAILFPVFAAARKSAYTAACISNLKQIGMVFAMYRDDNNGVNPDIWQKGGEADDFSDTGSFFWVITTYARTKLGPQANNIFKCPAAPWLKQVWTPPYERAHSGFAYNMNETGWTDLTYNKLHAGGRIRDSDVRRSKDLIFVGEQLGWVGYGIGYTGGQEFDMDEWTNSESGTTSAGSPGWTSTNPPLDEVIPLNPETAGRWGGTRCAVYNLRVNHRGGANFLFYDGHVKTLKTTYGKNWVVAY